MVDERKLEDVSGQGVKNQRPWETMGSGSAVPTPGLRLLGQQACMADPSAPLECDPWTLSLHLPSHTSRLNIERGREFEEWKT